ncbi:MAG: ABC transporter ATP-binding protein/permease, partial [Spirochaetaceae bacterium]|nr:ABC transporter ATP-binding protein/permease [Spirochaetaceae bacterium]
LVLWAMTARIHLFLVPLPAVFALLLFRGLPGFDWKNSAAALEEEEREKNLSAIAEETAAGRQTILTQALAVETTSRFFSASVFLRDARAQREKAAAAFLPGLYVWLFWGAALFLGFFLAARGMISPGGLASYAGFFAVFLYAARVCPPAWAALRQGKRTARRMVKLMTEKSPEKSTRETDNAAKEAAEENVPPGGVTFRGVFFSYASAVVLRRINFSVQPGMFVVIAGTTGSGKTTLARLVARVLSPGLGSALFGGDTGEERESVAFIEGAEPFLFPLTLRENIALGNPACGEDELREAAEKAGIHEFISALPQGYETRVGDGFPALAPDREFCVALARALLAKPRVLVIDDVAPSTDSAAEERRTKAIHAAARGRTAFVVSHRLSEIRWADYILFMKDGEIRAQGTHEQLVLASPDYRRIFSGL